MSERWTRDGELEHFIWLWSQRSGGAVDHSPEIWDARAERWIANMNAEPGKSARAKRIAATADQLRLRGLLGEDQTVADIGCGPGLFVLEFAKTAGQAVGIDYSSRFVEYARDLAGEQGVDNARFLQRDFLTLDIEQERLAGKFDLVFSCLTPAATAEGSLDKLMGMSRGWCCNTTIAHAEDTLARQVMQDVFGEEIHTRWNGRSFFALSNLLWLRGYYPETFYYDDVRVEVVMPDRRWAEKIASYCGKKEEGDIDRVEEYLTKLGSTPRRSASRYASVLWNVNRQDLC